MATLLYGIPVLGLGAETGPPDVHGTPCAECHPREAREFAQSAMARAAGTPDFLAEWARKGRRGSCLRCHAPGGGPGVDCADCHAGSGHPYPRLQVPQACAPCHDAPGENTVRSFLSSLAFRQGQDCVDCHFAGDGASGFSHALVGPTTAGFLDGVARVRAFVRGGNEGTGTLVVRVSHRAGHALPGGTTGRAVWLQLDGLNAQGSGVWRQRVRFGWEHDPRGGWRDRTLPPGPGRPIEIADPGRHGARSVRLALWFRFRPGGLERPDPRARLLDRLEVRLH